MQTNQGTVWATDLPHRWAVANAASQASYWAQMAEDWARHGDAQALREAAKCRAEAERHAEILRGLQS